MGLRLAVVRFSALILLVGLLSLFCAPDVFAAEPRTTTMDVAIVTEQATHLFSIGWERGELTATLIAPDGTRIPQDDPPPGVRVGTSERIIVFRVDQAMPGKWQAELRELDNGKIGCVVQKLIRPLLVEDVAARQDGGDILVDFTLSGEPGKECDYTVSLTLGEGRSGGRLLAEGQAFTGDEVRLSCDGADVGSYDRWVVTVYAECKSGDFTDLHSAASPPFAFSNPDAPGQVQELEAALLDAGVWLTWQPPGGAVPEAYIALLYGEDGQVVDAVRVEGGATAAILAVTAQGLVQVGVSSVRDGVAGVPVVTTVDTTARMSDLVGFDLPERPEIEDGHLVLSYDTGAATVPLRVEVGSVVDDFSLRGGGVVRVPVHNGTNRVTVSAQTADGFWVSQSRTWMLDLVAPGLRMFEDWDALVTRQSSLLLAGSVTDATAVEVNGARTAIGADGNFSARVSLDRGSNLVIVTATDAAGNFTVYEAHVDRLTGGGFPWWLFGGLLVTGAGVAAYVLWVIKKRRQVRT